MKYNPRITRGILTIMGIVLFVIGCAAYYFLHDGDLAINILIGAEVLIIVSCAVGAGIEEEDEL